MRKKNKKILKISLISLGVIIILALIYCVIAISFADDTVDCGDNVYCAPGMKASMAQKVASGTKNIFTTQKVIANNFEPQMPAGKKIVEVVYNKAGNGLYEADVTYNVPENYISSKSALSNTYNVGMNINMDTMMQDFMNIVSTVMVGAVTGYTYSEMNEGGTYWHTSETTYSDGSSRYNSYYVDEDGDLNYYTEYSGDDDSEAANDQDGDGKSNAADEDVDGDGEDNDEDEDDDQDGVDDEDEEGSEYDYEDTGKGIAEGTGIPSREDLASFSELTESISETLTSSVMTQNLVNLQTNYAMQSSLVSSLNTNLNSGLSLLNQNTPITSIEVTSISYS